MANQNQPDATGQAGETLIRIPLFKVHEALRFVVAQVKARAALRQALALAGDNHSLRDAIHSSELAAGHFARTAAVFNPMAIGGAA